MKILRGKTKPKGLRIVIYGVPGVGKTSCASKLKNNLFMDFEDGTHGLDVAKVAPTDIPKSYADMKGIFAELIKDHQGFEHITIDTADKCELALSETLAKSKGVEDIFAVNDFGRTIAIHRREMANVLDKATDLVNTGFDVIVLAHEITRKCEPLERNEGRTYDHTELRLSKTVTPLFMDWADVIVFLGYKTFLVSTDKGKNQVEGGKRWAFCSYSNDYEAKHRVSVNLPDDCPLDKFADILPKAIAEAVDRNNGTNVEVPDSVAKEESTQIDQTPVVEQPVKDSVVKLLKLLEQYGITKEKIAEYAEPKLKDRYGMTKDEPIRNWPDDLVLWLCRGMDKISTKIK